jgi:hypothetical protein
MENKAYDWAPVMSQCAEMARDILATETGKPELLVVGKLVECVAAAREAEGEQRAEAQRAEQEREQWIEVAEELELGHDERVDRHNARLLAKARANT